MSSTEPPISSSVLKGFCPTRHEERVDVTPIFNAYIFGDPNMMHQRCISVTPLLILSMTDSIPSVFLSMRNCIINAFMCFLYSYWIVQVLNTFSVASKFASLSISTWSSISLLRSVWGRRYSLVIDNISSETSILLFMSSCKAFDGSVEFDKCEVLLFYERTTSSQKLMKRWINKHNYGTKY